MICKIIKSEAFKKVRGSDIMKMKYHITLDGKNYMCLFWESLEDPIVYDKCFEKEIGTESWHVMKVGYAHGNSDYMHNYIARLNNILKEEGSNMSIDHINECKLDNRKENIRYVSQSEQNRNRKSRNDKENPCQELIDIGIEELPRHVRWDKTEEKFVLEKHPYLLKEVEMGIRNKPAMSGSKSKKLSVFEKFSDIMARLKELDDKYGNDDDIVDRDAFNVKKEKLRHEYEKIKETLYEYIGRAYTPPPDIVETNIDNISFSRNTLAGRKGESKLPEGCGVSLDQLPRYCYYVAAKGVRGDYFELSRNPKVKCWRTTSSKSVSTLDKFKLFMEKYNALEL